MVNDDPWLMMGNNKYWIEKVLFIFVQPSRDVTTIKNPKGVVLTLHRKIFDKFSKKIAEMGRGDCRYTPLSGVR